MGSPLWVAESRRGARPGAPRPRRARVMPPAPHASMPNSTRPRTCPRAKSSQIWASRSACAAFNVSPGTSQARIAGGEHAGETSDSISGPGAAPGDVTDEILAIYARYAQFATCGSLVAFIERLSRALAGLDREPSARAPRSHRRPPREPRQRTSSGRRSRTSSAISPTPTGQDHWDLPRCGADMDEGADPADREGYRRSGPRPLHRHGGRHTATGSTASRSPRGSTATGSWRAINMVHPGPNAS